MSKVFVFGTSHADVKGKADERGTVAVQAPTLAAAQAVFKKAKGPKDPRIGVVRLPRDQEHIDEALHAPDLSVSKEGDVTHVGDVATHKVSPPPKDKAPSIAAVYAALNAPGEPPAPARKRRPRKVA